MKLFSLIFASLFATNAALSQTPALKESESNKQKQETQVQKPSTSTGQTPSSAKDEAGGKITNDINQPAVKSDDLRNVCIPKSTNGAKAGAKKKQAGTVKHVAREEEQ